MGKHKNSSQIAIFLEFMEKHPDIAKGFSMRDKQTIEYLWKELCESLNSAGPPQKDINGWKKTWTEWKSDIKRKLAQNKAESLTTGGGPFTKESSVRIFSMVHSAEAVNGVSIDLSEDADTHSQDDMPSTSAKRPASSLFNSSTPKKARAESTGERLKKFLDEDNDPNQELNKKIDELIKIETENASSLRRVCRSIEKGNKSLTKAVNDIKKEFVRVNTAMLKIMKEKNDIKQKQLDLELQKFEYQKSKE